MPEDTLLPLLTKGQLQTACTLWLLKGTPQLDLRVLPLSTDTTVYKERAHETPLCLALTSITQPPAKTRTRRVCESVASTRLGLLGVRPRGPPHSHPYPGQIALGQTRPRTIDNHLTGEGNPSWFQRQAGTAPRGHSLPNPTA